MEVRRGVPAPSGPTWQLVTPCRANVPSTGACSPQRGHSEVARLALLLLRRWPRPCCRAARSSTGARWRPPVGRSRRVRLCACCVRPELPIPCSCTPALQHDIQGNSDITTPKGLRIDRAASCCGGSATQPSCVPDACPPQVERRRAHSRRRSTAARLWRTWRSGWRRPRLVLPPGRQREGRIGGTLLGWGPAPGSSCGSEAAICSTALEQRAPTWQQAHLALLPRPSCKSRPTLHLLAQAHKLNPRSHGWAHPSGTGIGTGPGRPDVFLAPAIAAAPHVCKGRSPAPSSDLSLILDLFWSILEAAKMAWNHGMPQQHDTSAVW